MIRIKKILAPAVPLLVSAAFLFQAPLNASSRAGEAGSLRAQAGNSFFQEKGGGTFEAGADAAFRESFSTPKPEGLKRVFVLGGSAAVLLGPGSRVAAPARGPGRSAAKIEIINCGAAGYGTFRIKELLNEVLKYKPDLLILLGPDPESAAAAPGDGRWAKLSRARARLLELYYVLRYGSLQAGPALAAKLQVESLREMEAAANKAGVPLVFCTLPYNVKDMPPQTRLPLGNAAVAAGQRLFFEKKYQAAFDKFFVALEAYRADAQLDFYLARTLEKLGKPTEALPYYLKAHNSDIALPHLGRNSLVKRAASYNSCVADLESLFFSLAGPDLPGFREFTDGERWRPGYNKAVWEELFRAAGACGVKGFGEFRAAPVAESARQDAVRRLSAAVALIRDEELGEPALALFAYLLVNSPGLLDSAAVSPAGLQKLVSGSARQEPDGAGLSAVFPFFLGHLAEAQRRRGGFDAARRLYEKALSLKRGSPQLTLGYARALAGMGRDKEAEKKFRALAEAGLAEAKGLLAAYGYSELPIHYRHLQSKANARPFKKTKIDMFSEGCFGEARSRKDREEALRACQSLVYLAGSGGLPAERVPGMFESDASFRSAKLLAELGRAEEALAVLQWTVSAAPPSWPGLAKARKEIESLAAR